jgi:uncharacterized protein YndB with AHSA1/START domain
MTTTTFGFLVLACALAGPALARQGGPGTSGAPGATPAGPVDTGPIVAEGVVNAAPVEVWRVFSTGEGFTALGPAKADVDLRVGGMIRAHYKADGVLGDEGTIFNRILAFEPERMMALRIDKPPGGFPFMDVYKNMWTVITLTDEGEGKTHVRCAAYGFGTDEQSQRMREFFRTGNDWTISKLRAKFDGSVTPKDIAMAHTDAPTAPLDLARVIAAPRASVFRAYTTGAGWKDFMGVEARIEPRPGGAFEVYFGPADTTPAGERGSEGCTVLSLVPGEMFSHTWNAPPKLAFARTQRTWVVVTFEELSPASTRVRLRQMGFDELAREFPEHAGEFAQTREYFRNAWARVLEELGKKFEPDVNK